MFQVLVVDDEPSAVDYICHLIRMKCPELMITATAENGREGLQKYLALRPDIVISDVKMPVMDGIAMVRAIMEENKHAQILLVSGYQEFEYVRAALKFGVSDYILKPITPAHFVAAIEPMLRRLERETYEQRKQLVRSMIAGIPVKPTDMRKAFSEERYFTALIRENGLPRRFAGRYGTELISELENTVFIYGRDEREALYICPERAITSAAFLDMMKKEAKKKQDGNRFITAVMIKNPVDTKNLTSAVEGLYKKNE